MHRQTDYAYQVPSETDFLYAQRFAYEGLGLLAMDLLGTTSLVAGLACTATGPASLNVNIGSGRIYALQTLEATAWGLFNSVGGLAVDTLTDHQIIKQGLFRDTTVFACAAPGTTGQSINYLIEASFSEVDAVPISLPFVSATAPYPPIAPNTLNTVRQDKCVITVKAGIAAATGSQTTPAVDAGNVGLYVVTVAYGQTTITSGNISLYSGAPFISETLTQKISQATGDARYVKLTAAPSTRQILTGGTTYTTPTGPAPRQLQIQMWGGGGGGGGAGTFNNTANGASGTAGSDTVFAGVHAGGGSGGTGGDYIGDGAAKGAGGLSSTGSATYLVRRGGIAGGPGVGSNGTTIPGGVGGPGGGNNASGAANANTGNGGDGGNVSGTQGSSGGGAGQGEYTTFVINNPSATYTYAIGAGGTGGANGGGGGGGNGFNGASGVIIVTEIY